MKIAFIGTHGTGKTTLAYSVTGELKRLGKNATMITEFARKCPLPINEKSTVQSQMWLATAQIAQEIEDSHKYEYVVCDRSVLDTLAYAVYSNVSGELLNKLVEQWIGSYDILFKVPMVYELVDDGFRSTDKSFQNKVEITINLLLKKYNLNCIELPKENRMQFVMEKIKEQEMKGQQKLTNF